MSPVVFTQRLAAPVQQSRLHLPLTASRLSISAAGCPVWVEACQPIYRTRRREAVTQIDEDGQLTSTGDGSGHQESFVVGSFRPAEVHRGHPGAAGDREDPDSPGPGSTAPAQGPRARGRARPRHLSRAGRHKHLAPGCNAKRQPGRRRASRQRGAIGIRANPEDVVTSWSPASEGPAEAALRDVTVTKSKHLRPPQDRHRSTPRAFETTMHRTTVGGHRARRRAATRVLKRRAANRCARASCRQFAGGLPTIALGRRWKIWWWYSPRAHRLTAPRGDA